MKNFSKNISLGGPILLEVNEKKYIIGFNSTYSNTCIGHRFTHNELSEIMKHIKNLRIDNCKLNSLSSRPFYGEEKQCFIE